MLSRDVVVIEYARQSEGRVLQDIESLGLLPLWAGMVVDFVLSAVNKEISEQHGRAYTYKNVSNGLVGKDVSSTTRSGYRLRYHKLLQQSIPSARLQVSLTRPGPTLSRSHSQPKRHGLWSLILKPRKPTQLHTHRGRTMSPKLMVGQQPLTLPPQSLLLSLGRCHIKQFIRQQRLRYRTHQQLGFPLHTGQAILPGQELGRLCRVRLLLVNQPILRVCL